LFARSRWWVLRGGIADLFPLPALEHDSLFFAMQLQRLDWVQELLVHPARLLQGCKSQWPFLTPSVLLISFDP
jgi:hypothetical protein